MRALAPVLFLILTIATSASAKTMVPITACGDTVPRGAIGYLTGDLDCSGMNETMGVIVLPGAGLELRGFTITGGDFGVACYDVRDTPYGPGFYTGGSCHIDGGGGRIVASYAHGIGGTNLRVANITIDGAGQEGVSADAKIRLDNVTITNCLIDGARGHGVTAVGSTITNSGENGMHAHVVRLIHTTVTGNGVGPDCGGLVYPARCADLLTTIRPHLKSSTCDTSLAPIQQFPPATWGVCQDD
jgi:hypothetical protein